MRYRACPSCQEALPQDKFFCATNPDPMHTPLCGYCLGVYKRRPRKSRTTLDALVAAHGLAQSRGWRPGGIRL